MEDLNTALRKRWESHENRPSIQKWSDIDALAESGVSKVIFLTKER
jgi:DNA primase small subunit